MPETKKGIKGRSLQDRAWMDMESRLDASLPVNHGMSNRERILLLLLLLMVVFMGSYIAHNEATKIKERPIDVLLDGDFAQHPQAEKQLKEQDQLIDTKAEINHERNQIISDGQGRNSNEKMAYTRTNSINTNNTKQFTRNETDSEELISYIDPTQSKDIDLSQTESLEMEESRFLGLSKLSDRSNFLSPTSQRENISISSVISYIPKTKNALCRNSYALNAGLISENLLSFGGFEGGLQYYYRFNRKFILQSGLHFNIFSKNGFSNSLALSTFENTPGRPPNEFSQADNWVEKRYKYEVENSEIINNEVGAEYITGIVDRLYYVSIPVNLMYNIRKTQIYAGINASLLLRGTNMIRDYDDQYFNTVILSNSVIEKRNYLNRIDIGLQLGVETPVWNNVHFYAKYNHGLFKIINADSAEVSNSSFRDTYETIYQKSFDQRVDFNRYFTVGLKYLIQPCN